jgi:prepilin-type N-terminal cleavage/methylation domain-containing protein
MRPKKTSAGFTLPEVLAVMVIVGMILTLLYSVWSTTLNATATGTEATQDVQRERMALKALTDALAGASWYENRTEETLRLDHAEGFSRLKILSRVPPGFWGERELGGHPLRRIEFRAEPNGQSGFQLVMLQQTVLASTNSAEFHRTVLLPHLETFSVEVPSADPLLPWANDWPLEAGTNALPRQAKVTLAVREKNPRIKTLPIFANAATHARGLPSIGRVIRVSEAIFGEDGFDVDGSDSTARIIFIIDKSGSMRGPSLEVAKDALLKSLRGMQEGGKFYIYFFNRGAESMPSSAMLEANPDNIVRVSEWVRGQEARGGSDPGLAITAAFAHDPTELFLLSDGGIYSRKNEQSVRDLLLNLSSAKAVKVNTVGIGDFLRGREDETLLMLIAKDHGGTYTSLEPLTVVPPPPAPKK